MKRLPPFAHFTLNVLLVLAGLLLSWTASFYLTAAAYSRIGREPHDLLALIINALLGFLLFGFAMAILGRFIRSREHRFWTELLEAIRRISRGDFHVNLEPQFGDRSGKQRNRHPLHQLVASINDMAANLKEMEELRQEFISNVSHEIGTPLTSISGFARALKNEQLEPQLRQRYLTIIEEECLRLSKLADNLLKLAVLDSERHPFQPAPYRLDKQLAAVILACEPQWASKSIEMNVEMEEITIAADEMLLGQVWTNLIHNAIKFTAAGGTISVSAMRQGACAVVRIADTGAGIAEADLPRIFERFYKADKSRTRSAGGSGLGLSIAHKITEMHRGSIEVSSRLGEGTEFTVSLPL
ncbi:sensor histidine kinase [Paenibacillus ginsengihumi]|uniref:sensor histidine kinase n=1 Tax=Paenibacillus ginsengihumi TaxID=431596 RepID=UPI000369E7F4|nr:HAMP domain-containing sensor histidine kinase [Paenibacillus ginsengihumi]